MRVKVSVADLQVGMFVAELDRPWLDSPFLFQGFEIADEADLAQLRQVCGWVMVEDTLSKVAVDLAALEQRGEARAIEDYRVVARRAAESAKRARDAVDQALEAVRLGHTMNAATAQLVVAELVDEVSTNVNAALWLTGLKKKHGRIAEHCLNTCVLALSFAKALGYGKDELQEIGMGALLHDIGLGRVPGEVLDKPGTLDEAEWAAIHAHPHESVRIMAATRALPRRTLDIIHRHHERVDGSGYPDRLKDDEVDRSVRLVAICDAYDTMTSDQPWRPALLPQKALTLLLKESAGTLGRELIEQFIKCIGIYPVGSMVLLSTGALAVVLASEPATRLKPMVLVVREPGGKPSPPGSIVNLGAVARLRKSDAWTIAGLVDPRPLGIDIAKIVEGELGR